MRKPVSAKKILDLFFAVLHFNKYGVTNNLNGCSIVRIKGNLQVSVILNVLWEPLNYLRMGLYNTLLFKVVSVKKQK